MGKGSPGFFSKHFSRRFPPERRLGFALAGLGKLSKERLAPALAKTKYCRLSAVITGTPAKAEAWKKLYGLSDESVYDYETMERLADNPNVDIVYVSTPTALHGACAIRAARAGKHVFCEKPLETSAERCRRMIEACREAGRRLGVAYRLDYERNYLECIRLARERVFGELRSIDAEFEIGISDPTQWRLDRELAGGGPLLDIGIYALQVTRRLTGEDPVRVSATESRIEPANPHGVEESVVWDAEFPGGATARCRAAYGARRMSRFRAHADRGWFELDPAFTYDGIRGRRSDGYEIRFPAVDQFAAEMDDFAQSILENRPAGAPGEEGLRDVEILSAIYDSAATGRPVDISAHLAR